MSTIVEEIAIMRACVDAGDRVVDLWIDALEEAGDVRTRWLREASLRRPAETYNGWIWCRAYGPDRVDLVDMWRLSPDVFDLLRDGHRAEPRIGSQASRIYGRRSDAFLDLACALFALRVSERALCQDRLAYQALSSWWAWHSLRNVKEDARHDTYRHCKSYLPEAVFLRLSGGVFFTTSVTGYTSEEAAKKALADALA